MNGLTFINGVTVSATDVRYINQGGQFLNAIRGSFLHCR